MNKIIEFVSDIDEPQVFPNSNGLIIQQIAIDVLVLSKANVSIANLEESIEVFIDKNYTVHINIKNDSLNAQIFILPACLICASYVNNESNQYWHKIIIGNKLGSIMKVLFPQKENYFFVAERSIEAQDISNHFG